MIAAWEWWWSLKKSLNRTRGLLTVPRFRTGDVVTKSTCNGGRHRHLDGPGPWATWRREIGRRSVCVW
ncbi:hypothetical protein YC2023_068099 [Brassica napus]